MSNLDKQAMPVPGLSNLPNDYFIYPEAGLTIRQHAAITMRVPMSGDTELDAMIREARRLDMATAAMQGMLSNTDERDEALHRVGGLSPITAENSMLFADALLAASEPKKAEPECRCDMRTKLVGDGCEVCNPELAKELSEPQPDAEGWIEWKGGECPVRRDTRIRVRLRSGAEDEDPAGNYDWRILGAKDDIIAYRVVK